jgi:Fur family transcriptional regulator, ferric uptake regulator
MSKLLEKCIAAGLKMTEQRKVIIRALEDSGDHPSVEVLCDRAKKLDSSISIATVYRTLGLLDELGLVLKHGFGGDSARFEIKPEHDHDHHHHLIDTETGQVLEFQNAELEALTHKIAAELGYEIIDHTFEIFGHKIKEK